MSLQFEISNFIKSLTFASIEQGVIEKAKMHIIDTLGVIIAGTEDKIFGTIKNLITELSKEETCSIIGTNIKASLLVAALSNGILAHALDYDDSSWRMIGHPSAAVLPAVLSLGEYVSASGAEVISAYLVGTEVACKLGVAAEPSLYEAGWHATGVLGVLGAASACCYLLKLPEEKIENALGIAASLACGIRQNMGTMTKPLHAGAAAHNGLLAALLAKSGFEASSQALEGRWGFFENFTRGEKEGSLISPGQPFDIYEPGFFIKPYPSCAATHTAIDAMLSLVREYGITHEQIESIEVGTGPVGPIMLFRHRPERGTEGKFSMPFVMAVSAVDGKVTIDSFKDEKLGDPRIRRIIERTKMYVAEEFADKSIDEAPAIVKVVLADGREYVKKVIHPLGSPQNPMTVEQVVEKYRDCTLRALPPRQVERSLEMLWKLEQLPDIRELIKDLTIA